MTILNKNIDNINNNKCSILGRKPRIVLDMDDVIVDYVGTILKEYNQQYNTNYTINDCTEWHLENIFGTAINDYIYFQGRFDDLPIKNNSVKYIKDIIESNRYDVFIVTASPPQGFIEKYNWVKKYMPFFNLNRLIPCSEKSAIWTDVIVDDKYSNVVEVINKTPLETPTFGFVYDMPHNRADESLSNCKRIKDLSNLLGYLDELFYINIKE